MNSLPLRFVKRDSLDHHGRELWDFIVATRGKEIVNKEGGLDGPFNVWIRNPSVGVHLANLGSALRFESSLEGRLLELVIITVGAHWKAEYEWWIHSDLARVSGISTQVVEALREGEDPPFERDDEKLVHRMTSLILGGHRLDEETFDTGVKVLGESTVIEIVELCGYYTLLSFTLNSFAVPLPPNASRSWSDSKV